MNTYLIKDKVTGFYKIGKTTNIKKRFSTLSTSNLNLEIVLIIPNDEEKFLHKYFNNKKVEKEWYCLNTNDLQDMEELKFELLKKELN